MAVRKKIPGLRRGENVTNRHADDLGDWVPELKGWALDLLCGQDSDGRWVVSRACLRPTTEGIPGGVDVATWRKVPLGALVAQAVADTAAEADDIQRDYTVHEWRHEKKRLVAAWAKRRGPTGFPDYMYAVLGWHYLLFWRRGDRKATETVAALYDMPRATAARRLREARQRGLLLSSGQGRAGGELSKEAEALLQTAEAQHLMQGE